MMMTSGAAVKYDSSLHCFREVIKHEGYKSLFKGAGANILRAIAGAGVLSGYVSWIIKHMKKDKDWIIANILLFLQ